MKNTFKIFLTALVLGIYFLFAVSTSKDEGAFIFIDGNVVNTSDTCDINNLRFIFAVNNNNDDTIPAPVIGPFAAGDTVFINFIDSLPYHTFLYSCICGDTTFIRNVPFIQGPTSTFPTFGVGCD